MLFTRIIEGQLGVWIDVLLLAHILAVLYWISGTLKEIKQDAASKLVKKAA
jgi:hypothetical protein